MTDWFQCFGLGNKFLQIIFFWNDHYFADVFCMMLYSFRFLMQSYGNPDAKDVESFMNLSQVCNCVCSWMSTSIRLVFNHVFEVLVINLCFLYLLITTLCDWSAISLYFVNLAIYESKENQS